MGMACLEGNQFLKMLSIVSPNDIAIVFLGTYPANLKK